MWKLALKSANKALVPPSSLRAGKMSSFKGQPVLSIKFKSSPLSVRASRFLANRPKAESWSISILNCKSSPNPTTSAVDPEFLTTRILTPGVGAVFVTIFVPVGWKGTLEGRKTTIILGLWLTLLATHVTDMPPPSSRPPAVGLKETVWSSAVKAHSTRTVLSVSCSLVRHSFAAIQLKTNLHNHRVCLDDYMVHITPSTLKLHQHIHCTKLRGIPIILLVSTT